MGGGQRRRGGERAAVRIDRLMKHLVLGYLLNLLMRARAQQNEKPARTTEVFFSFRFLTREWRRDS